MSFSVFDNYSHTQAQTNGQVTIYCDNVSDIANLATHYAVGSTAIVVATGLPTYMLNNAGTWTAV